MDQSYSLFTLIFKGVHEPFGFDSLLLLTFLRSSRMLRISGFILDGVYKRSPKHFATVPQGKQR